MNYKYIVLLFVCQLVQSQINVDSTSTEFKQHIKQELQLRQRADSLARADNLEKSIFGTNSTTYNFVGYNYDSYADGKYSEVAKAENWSKWSLPENMDKRLEEYESKKKVKLFSFVSIFVLIVLAIIGWFTKKKSSNCEK